MTNEMYDEDTDIGIGFDKAEMKVMPTNIPVTGNWLADIKARCEAATEGPWAWDGGEGDVRVGIACDEHDAPISGYIVDGENAAYAEEVCWIENDSSANAEFIAHAREDIPTLLAEVERLHDLGGDLCRATSKIEHYQEMLDQAQKDCFNAATERDEARAEIRRLKAKREWVGVLASDYGCGRDVEVYSEFGERTFGYHAGDGWHTQMKLTGRITHFRTLDQEGLPAIQ